MSQDTMVLDKKRYDTRMIICGIQLAHYPSVCVIENGKIIYYNEERKLSQDKKVDSIPYNCIDQLINFKIDKFILIGYNFSNDIMRSIVRYFKYKKININAKAVLTYFYPHHISHFFKACVDSGFTEGNVFVIDGRGSDWYFDDHTQGYETCSIFSFNSKEIKCIYKNVFTKSTSSKKINIYHDPYYNHAPKKVDPYFHSNETVFNISNSFDLGHIYENMSARFGYQYEEGKFMGLTAFGKSRDDYYDKLSHNLLDKIPINYDSAATVQKYFEDKYLELVKKFEHKNMVFTGGTALNVVNNYKIKKAFPNSNLYFEPLCADEGNSIGAAYLGTYFSGENLLRNKSIYIGTKIKDLNEPLNKNEIMKENVEIDEIIKLLTEGKVIGLIQGNAEAGPRALGNRSLLLDPTIKNCKDIMNEIKKREKFRPFACSVLEENVNDYFDLDCPSPHMMLAPQATAKAKTLIPGLVHNDGTCRVQTVNQHENEILYLLLKNFKIPVLMNTSFNLAGYPMVETFKDILFSIRNSSLNYVYFADYKKLLISK